MTVEIGTATILLLGRGGLLVADDEIVFAQWDYIAYDCVFDVGRVVLDILAYHFAAGSEFHGNDPGTEGCKGLGMHGMEEVEIESISGGLHGQDVFAHRGGIGTFLGEGGFEHGQSLTGMLSTIIVVAVAVVVV